MQTVRKKDLKLFFPANNFKFAFQLLICYKIVAILFLGCTANYPIIVLSDSNYVNATGEFTCANGQVLFYSNGVKPTTNKTICQPNAQWSGQDNLECWTSMQIHNLPIILFFIFIRTCI